MRLLYRVHLYSVHQGVHRDAVPVAPSLVRRRLLQHDAVLYNTSNSVYCTIHALQTPTHMQITHTHTHTHTATDWYLIQLSRLPLTRSPAHLSARPFCHPPARLPPTPPHPSPALTAPPDLSTHVAGPRAASGAPSRPTDAAGRSGPESRASAAVRRPISSSAPRSYSIARWNRTTSC